jgi:Hemerythrin HHE cation binding domain
LALRKNRPESKENTMPASKKKKNSSVPAKRSPDAIALLKADHREVAGWFEQFDGSPSEAKKAKLAQQICTALKVHTQIEEEIFYPAFIDATKDEDMHHEAVVEHRGAKGLIAEIEASTPQEEYFDAQVKVLSEMIKHHVKEEEQPGGMFAKARKSKMDLSELGSRMAARKAELMGAKKVGGSVQRLLEKAVNLAVPST